MADRHSAKRLVCFTEAVAVVSTTAGVASVDQTSLGRPGDCLACFEACTGEEFAQ